MQLGLPKHAELAYVHMADMRKQLGIASGGSQALTALAALSGGDYIVGGLEKVGEKAAMQVVAYLLKGRQVRSCPPAMHLSTVHSVRLN